MPLIKLLFKPGINKETTALADKTTWFAGNNVRFRTGNAEKIGGWVLDTGTNSSALKSSDGQYWGIGRSLFNWASITSQRLLGLGTSLKYYIQAGNGGSLNDVTPLRIGYTALSCGFEAQIGSSVITVNTVSPHDAVTGAFVTFSGAVSLGGNITANILNAEFQIQSIVDTNSFTIKVSAAANASDVGNGGSSVTAAFQINPNASTYSPPQGWGAGGWGGVNIGNPSTGWGYSVSYAAANVIQLWSQSNYGENLVFNQRGGGLFYWVLDDNNPAIFYRAQQLSPKNTNTQIGNVGVTTQYWFTDGAIFTATISGNTMTVSAVTVGTINVGATISGTGVTTGSTITGFVSGSLGSIGVYTLSTSSTVPSSTTITSELSACPTLANFVIVSDQSRFVIAYGTDNMGDGQQDPMLISWSDQENITTWNPLGTNQAGNFRLSTGSQIVTAIQIRQEILVFTDVAIYSQQYLGPPYVWGFQIMGNNISILSQNSVVVANNTAFWMGVDKFYMYNGTVQTLPSAMRQYVYENINLRQSAQFFAGLNEGFSEVWWFYCSASSTTIDSYVIYNYLDNSWSYGNTDGNSAGKSAGYVAARTAWTYSSLRGGPMSTGYSPSAANGSLIYQESGVDDGTTVATIGTPTAIKSYIQSGDFDIGEGDRYGFAWRMIPDVSFDGSNVTNPSCYMTLLPRQNPGSPYTVNVVPPVVASTQSYSNSKPFYGTQQFTPQINIRVRGRQIAMVVGSNTLGTQWQVGIPRMDVRSDGRRA